MTTPASTPRSTSAAAPSAGTVTVPAAQVCEDCGLPAGFHTLGCAGTPADGSAVEVDSDYLRDHPDFAATHDVLVQSPSGWIYRASQENGDGVDCHTCGSLLDDDYPITSDVRGYAHHGTCPA